MTMETWPYRGIEEVAGDDGAEGVCVDAVSKEVNVRGLPGVLQQAVHVGMRL